MSSLSKAERVIAEVVVRYLDVVGPSGITLANMTREILVGLREPTEAQYDAVSNSGKMWREQNSSDVWRTMIDGAIGEVDV